MAERVLIAEEDDGLREALASRLRQGAVRVHEASDIGSATEILSRNKIDVVVVGLAGFESDGLELLKMIKRIQPQVEVVLLVGKHQGSLAITGMKLGAFRDAQLPIHVESFRKIIQEAFNARKERLGRNKRRFLTSWPKLFAAVTFAEHGEFETAIDIQGSGSKETEED
jgi:two-component system NtrC family response regulator